MQPAMQSPPRRAGFCLLASLGVLSTVGLSLGSNEQGRVKASGGSKQATGASAGLTDAELRAMILGRWRTETNGTRVVDNRADGTASMDVTFDFVASFLYGDKMQLELTWQVQQGLLVYTIQSGSPKSTVSRIVSTYGSQATYRFQSIGERRMHLVRLIDPSESYVWTRVDGETK